MPPVMESMKYTDWPLVEKGEVHQSIYAEIQDYDEAYYSNGSATDYSSGLERYYSVPLASSKKSYSFKNTLQFATQIAMPRSPANNSFNLTAVCIDTLTAKLASIKAVPQAVTDRGTTNGRKLAEDLNFLLKGVFHKCNINHLINLAYKEAMINRVGFLKVIVDDNDCKVEQVFSDEVIVDPIDGYYNEPYKLIHRKLVPKHVMLDLFPQFADQIHAAEEVEVTDMANAHYTPSLMVAEAWCKNTYKKKGRHVLCISNCDLIDEKWDKDYFPIVKCDFNPPCRGYYGQSLVDQLSPIQDEIDRLMRSIAAIIKLVAVPRVFADTMANVSKDHFTSKIGTIIEYTSAAGGVAPIIHNGSALAPEIMQYLEFNVAQGWAVSGLTDVDAQGAQPVGMGNSSGEALKKMTDIKNERWQFLKTMYEDTHVQLGNIILGEMKNKKIKISAIDRRIGMRSMDSSVIPDIQDSYVLKMFPVSSLPNSIPDLMDSAEKMMNLGLIQKSQLYELFDMPDIDSEVAIMTAPYKLIEGILDGIVHEGKYMNPEPYFDLQYAAVVSIKYYNWAILNKISEDRLVLLRQFISDVKTLMSQAPMPAPAPQPMPQQPQAPQQSQQQ